MFGVIRRCVQGVSGRRVGRFSLMVARASQCSAAGVSCLWLRLIPSFVASSLFFSPVMTLRFSSRVAFVARFQLRAYGPCPHSKAFACLRELPDVFWSGLSSCSQRLSMAGSCLRYVLRLTGLEDNMLWSSTSQRNSLSFGSSCGCVSNCFICRFVSAALWYCLLSILCV